MKKENYHKVLSLLLSVILVIITAGCTKTEAPPAAGTAMSDEDQEEITLRVSWWGPEARHEATLKAMERYMELHSNITLVGEYSDWNGHYDKLVTQIASDTAPDIMQINDRWYYDFMSGMNAVVDMNTLSDYVDLNAFDKSFLEDYCLSLIHIWDILWMYSRTEYNYRRKTI